MTGDNGTEELSAVLSLKARWFLIIFLIYERNDGSCLAPPDPQCSVCRPASGDSGYYSRPPPAIVRRSASPPAPADSDHHNPFAQYRSWDQFRNGKQGVRTSGAVGAGAGGGEGGGHYSKYSSEDFGERRRSGQRQLYSANNFNSRKVSNSSTESDSCFGSLSGTGYSDDRADYRMGLFRNQESNSSSYSSSATTSRVNKTTSAFSSSRSTSPTKFSLGALK